MSTNQRRSQIKERPNDVWEEISPLNAPYPMGTEKLEEIIQPEQLHQNSIQGPEIDMFVQRQEGYFVEVK